MTGTDRKISLLRFVLHQLQCLILTSSADAAAVGFKLDTLLKLADVKGTDRKTSLLHFVLDQLLKDSPGMRSLPNQLASVKAAANLQVSIAVLSAPAASLKLHWAAFNSSLHD